ncbi:MAG TPA: hypothetical protein VLF39_00910 [Candidatus Saccharimonadales bacterium]|nr:hypothetical protein [Candidatus Saccharimonadales bacterium]
MSLGEQIRSLEPADALWNAIADTNLGLVDGETLIGGAEARLGYPLAGQIRTDLLSLADGEVTHYKETVHPGYLIIDKDEYWLDNYCEPLTPDEAMQFANQEVLDYLSERAIKHALLQIKEEKPHLMQSDLKAKRMAELATEFALGIKPIFEMVEE